MPKSRDIHIIRSDMDIPALIKLALPLIFLFRDIYSQGFIITLPTSGPPAVFIASGTSFMPNI